MRTVQRHDMLLVAKEVSSRREISRVRRDLQLERLTMLARLMSRLQMQRLPSGSGIAPVPVLREVGDLINGHRRSAKRRRTRNFAVAEID